jgi:hypothetical protein
MADTKRKFYNSGDAKGFTKAIFFQTVEAMANGEDVDPGLVALVGAAASYELEGIALKSNSKAPGEKKDPLDSDYAKALAAAIVPLVPTNGDGLTAKELIELATNSGKLSPKGTPFAAPWVSRVLNATEGVNAQKKVVETTDAKGLKSQKEVTAYTR